MGDEDRTAEKAFSKINRLTSMREYASKELRDRLLRDGFDEPAAEEALERALSCGLVDDLRFAEMLARSRVRAGKGRQGIEAELARLDIEASDIEGWPEAFVAGEDEEVARAVELLERKPPTSKNKRDAAYRRLVGKGYASSVASTAARRWFEGLG